MRSRLASGVLVVAVLVVGCTSTHRNVGIGAGAGAVLGAVAGGVIGHQSGHRTEGALIGAGIGALSGALVGYWLDKRAAEKAARENHPVEVIPKDAKGQEKVVYTPVRREGDNVIVEERQIDANGQTVGTPKEGKVPVI